MEDHLSSSDTSQVWQGVLHITSYKSTHLSATEGDTLMAEELNPFFVSFEVESLEAGASQPPLPKRSTISSLNEYLTVPLKPIAMKCFEKIVRSHIVSSLPPAFYTPVCLQSK